MNVLELFAGAGGGVIASGLLGHRVVCAVEIDPFCREILMRRQEDGSIPPFPIWDDVRTFDGKPWNGTVDVVSGGFPCQPFSVAGKQLGEKDDRNLWPEMLRVIREVGPRYVFAENVPGLVRRYLPRVLGDLSELGFDAEWGVLGASDVGAPHLRKRLWVLAYPNGGGREEEWGDGILDRERSSLGNDSDGRNGPPVWSWEHRPEPVLRRVDDGVAHRLHRHRLKSLGNGQVPQCYAESWRSLYLKSTRPGS